MPDVPEQQPDRPIEGQNPSTPLHSEAYPPVPTNKAEWVLPPPVGAPRPPIETTPPPPVETLRVPSASDKWPQENDSKWVAQRETLLHQKLGLHDTPTNNQINDAYDRYIRSESEDQRLSPHKDDQLVRELMREHDNRTARKELGLPKDASERDIFDAVVKKSARSAFPESSEPPSTFKEPGPVQDWPPALPKAPPPSDSDPGHPGAYKEKYFDKRMPEPSTGPDIPDSNPPSGGSPDIRKNY